VCVCVCVKLSFFSGIGYDMSQGMGQVRDKNTYQAL